MEKAILTAWRKLESYGHFKTAWLPRWFQIYFIQDICLSAVCDLGTADANGPVPH